MSDRQHVCTVEGLGDGRRGWLVHCTICGVVNKEGKPYARIGPARTVATNHYWKYARKAASSVTTPKNSDVVAAYEAEVREWSARLARFCDELEKQGFQVERDGLNVHIKAPAPGGSDGAS